MSVSYPRPRPTRGQGIPSGGGGGGPIAAAIPRVRIWPFMIAAQLNRFAVLVSPGFQGPAVITHVQLHVTVDAAATRIQECGLFVSQDDGGTVEDVVADPVTSGRNVFDTGQISDSAIAGDEPAGSLAIPSVNGKLYPVMEIRVPVTESRFWLKWRYRSPSGAGQGINGWIRVIEGLTLEDLPNFL